MATGRINDSRAFRDFLDAKLGDEDATLPLDEALFEWELENQTDDERDATVEAVKEALADMRAGDKGIPAREFLAEMRRKYQLPA